jgi:hypothetical protein
MGPRWWSLVLFVSIFAAHCGVPPLDRTGVIRCGSDRVGGGCPPQWSCRFGRCCPPGSTNESCPLNVETDGSVKCSVRRECPIGLACRFDRCCPNTGGTGLCSDQRVGAPCESAGACGPGLTCFSQSMSSPYRALGGYCVRPEACNPADEMSCGPGNVCVGGNCFARCVVPPDAEASMMPVPCRVDRFSAAYSCRRISFDSASTDGVCLPDCRGAVAGMTVCQPNTTCDMQTGDCSNRCMTATDCPSVQYDCEHNECVARFIGCGSDAECNAPNSNEFECRSRPEWPDPEAKICTFRLPGTCVDGFVCRQSRRTESGLLSFNCILGVCVVKFTPTQ